MNARRWVFWVMVFGGCNVLAGGNLFTNADVAAGMDGWWASVKKDMQEAGCRQGVENGRWVAEIPDHQPREQAAVLVGHAVSLQKGTTYRLSYTLILERAGTMRHVYHWPDAGRLCSRLVDGGLPERALGLQHAGEWQWVPRIYAQ